MATTIFLALDANGNPKPFQVEQALDGSLTFHSVPEIGGLAVASDNPMPVSSAVAPAASLTGATVAGDGDEIDFGAGKSTIGMQVSYTGAPSAMTVTLRGTIDGDNWFALATFTLVLNQSGDILASSGIPVIAARADLDLLTGSAAVSATILAV